jgi:hypothetical protein
VGKCFAERTVARPAFCIPTSIEIVRHFNMRGECPYRLTERCSKCPSSFTMP